MQRHLSIWSLPDLLSARRELQRDYWAASGSGRVIIQKKLVELEMELLHREEEIEAAAARDPIDQDANPDFVRDALGATRKR